MSTLQPRRLRPASKAALLLDRPPESWHSFFLEIDEALTQPVELHCLGGFALAMHYALPRLANDVDYLSNLPADEVANLESLAGKGSALHEKYGVYLHAAGSVIVPDSYHDRLTSLFPAAYQRLRLAALDGYDLVLSKLERNSARDREEVKFLSHAVQLNPAVLEDRYHLEVRPYLTSPKQQDQTVRLWIEMLAGR